MIEVILPHRTINGAQYDSDSSPKETYRTTFRETVVVVDVAQVRLSDVPLHPSPLEVDFLHPLVE